MDVQAFTVNEDSMCGALICEQPALRRPIRQQHPGESMSLSLGHVWYMLTYAVLNATQRNVTIQEEVAGQKYVAAHVLHKYVY